MNEQAKKLEQVKKSCGVAKKVTSVFTNIFRVCAILCIVGCAIMFAYKDKVNSGVAASIEAGKGEINFDRDLEIGGIVSFSMKADVEQLMAEGEYAYIFMMYMAYGAAVLIVLMILFMAFKRIFVIIEESDTPFAKEVLDKLKKAFIFTVVMLALLDGPGSALIAALILWCIYCILDYGAALQTEVDETL